MDMLHPASLVSQAEAMAYLGFDDDQIAYLIDHEIPLSIALHNAPEYAKHVMDNGYKISISHRKLSKVDDDGYTDIFELEDELYQIVFEEHITF